MNVLLKLCARVSYEREKKNPCTLLYWNGRGYKWCNKSALDQSGEEIWCKERRKKMMKFYFIKDFILQSVEGWKLQREERWSMS